MATSIYHCSTTGLLVQGWFTDNGCEGRANVYEGITCLVCGQIHFVNRQSRDVVGRGSSGRRTAKDGFLIHGHDRP